MTVVKDEVRINGIPLMLDFTEPVLKRKREKKRKETKGNRVTQFCIAHHSITEVGLFWCNCVQECC